MDPHLQTTQSNYIHTYIQTSWFHIDNFSFASEIVNYKTTYIYEHPVHLLYNFHWTNKYFTHLDWTTVDTLIVC